MKVLGTLHLHFKTRSGSYPTSHFLIVQFKFLVIWDQKPRAGFNLVSHFTLATVGGRPHTVFWVRAVVCVCMCVLLDDFWSKSQDVPYTQIRTSSTL